MSRLIIRSWEDDWSGPEGVWVYGDCCGDSFSFRIWSRAALIFDAMAASLVVTGTTVAVFLWNYFHPARNIPCLGGEDRWFSGAFCIFLLLDGVCVACRYMGRDDHTYMPFDEGNTIVTKTDDFFCAMMILSPVLIVNMLFRLFVMDMPCGNNLPCALISLAFAFCFWPRRRHAFIVAAVETEGQVMTVKNTPY